LTAFWHPITERKTMKISILNFTALLRDMYPPRLYISFPFSIKKQENAGRYRNVNQTNKIFLFYPTGVYYGK
jgi:hypothetical protein